MDSDSETLETSILANSFTNEQARNLLDRLPTPEGSTLFMQVKNVRGFRRR
jgi:hypothetical protein